MSVATVTTGKDTWVDSTQPSKNNGATVWLTLRGSPSTKYAYVYLPNPAPRGAVVTSASLFLSVRSGWGSARSVTARRVTSSYAMSKATWSKRPTDTATGASTATVTPSPNDVGGFVELDVTDIVQAWANGADNYGLRISTTYGDFNTRVAAFNHPNHARRPRLVVEWEDRPKKPTGLKPSASVVSVEKPTLAFDFVDVSGDRNLASVQVQIDPSMNGASPAFDSGEVPVEAPQLDLRDTAYAGLASGSATSWRVRAKDGSGLWSEWSDWATFGRVAKGTVTILSPDPGADPVVVEDVTPPILWSFTGTTNPAAWRVLVSTPTNPTVYIHDSGHTVGADNSYTIPGGVLKGSGPYRLKVRVYDDAPGREVTPGDFLYAEAQTDFVMATDGTVTAPASLASTIDSDLPRVTLTWARTNAPDRWTILRDGEVIASEVDPDDTIVSAGVHTWTDYTAQPGHDHEYAVRAVVNGKQSDDVGTAITVTVPTRPGIFLVDEDGATIALAGNDGGTWSEPEEDEVFLPVGARTPVRVVYGQRGFEGQLSGTLIDGFGGLGLDEQIEHLYRIKSTPAARRRLVVADLNFPALIGRITVAPSTYTRSGQLLRDVSFEFWQVGEYRFDTP